MASNTTPRRGKKVSFSTANIGTSQSRGLGAASPISPSQLVLGYSGGKLIRTPPANSSPKVEDPGSPRSPTPRPKLPSLAQPRSVVNHRKRALGGKPSLSPFPNLPSTFSTTSTSPRDLPNKEKMVAGEVPAVPQVASPPVDDWNVFGANLLREAHNYQSRDPTAATAAQPALNSNIDEVDFDEFLIFPDEQEDDEGNKEKEQVPPAQGPATPAEEPLPTNSEFPTNTGADKNQWKAAVQANPLTSNPFNLNIPDRAHRRTETQENLGMMSSNHHLGDMSLTNATHAYERMVNAVEKAKAGSRASSTVQGGSKQAATMNTDRNPFSGPATAMDLGPDFDANFAEMMATLENSRPGDHTYTTNTGDHQSAQSSLFGIGTGQDLGDMSFNEAQMGSVFQTPIQSTNHSTAQENIMSTVNQTGGSSSSAIQADTPDLLAASQMGSMNHSTSQVNIINNDGQTGESSTVQSNITDAFLGSGFSNLTHMSQSTGQGNTTNNGGYSSSYGSGAQDGNSSSKEAFGTLPWEAAFANNQSYNSTNDMAGFPIQENTVPSMATTSSLTQEISGANVVASSPSQTSSTNAGGYPPPVIPTFTGGTQEDLIGVPGEYKMPFMKSPSQMIDDAYASGQGPNAQSAQTTSSPAVNNSMGSELGHMSPQASGLTNFPVTSSVDLTRSATPNQSAINLIGANSPALANTTAGSTVSNSPAPSLAVTGAAETSTGAVSPNPLHPAGFYLDPPRAQDTPLITVSPNPLHPPSFHQPTPRSVWPTSRRPIPPNPAVSGNTPGYFQPDQDSNTQGNMNMNMNMNMQSGQQFQYNMNVGGQQNMQMPMQFPRPMQPNSWDYMVAQSAIQNQAIESANQAQARANRMLAPTPRGTPGTHSNNMIRHRINQIESQPLTAESADDLRRLQLVDRMQGSLRGYTLNGRMPFDGRPPPPITDFLAMEPRQKNNNVKDRVKPPLALDLLIVGENFECAFCTPEEPNLYGVERFADLREIWGSAGHDWCADCVRTGKNLLPAAAPEEMDVDSLKSKNDKKRKGKGKRPAKESAGPEPSPKKPANPSRSSSINASTSSASGAPASYDRYAHMSDESNVFGDPQDIFSRIDNIKINPFMHNLMCRGSAYRQIDPTKTKICERCKAKKLQIISHACHTEFTHITALDTPSWLYGSTEGFPGASQFDGSDDMNAGFNLDGSNFDVNADLNNGSMTLADINSVVNAGLNASDDMSSGMNFDMNGDMELIVPGDSMDGVSFDRDASGLKTPTNTAPSQSSNNEDAHVYRYHMNGRQHSTITKLCMVCPSKAIFLCDGCPLTLCEHCRYKLRVNGQGWFNNLIYTNGVNHNRNDAFLLRSDNGGYHEYGKFWPNPPHVNL
ncbi:hypothetical protein NHQ30_003249 [Ciborinia camelliae]|nr:hypothetical protein NHQ30_003249 [Ciborinia camelliae]